MEEQINGFDRFDGCHGFDGLDMDLVSVFHMDMDWIWIYGSVEDGLWIGYGSRFQSIQLHSWYTYNQSDHTYHIHIKNCCLWFKNKFDELLITFLIVS